MANRQPTGAAAPQAASAAAEPCLGYLIPEEAHLRFQRAAIIAGLIAECFGEIYAPRGQPLMLDSRQIAALGELLEIDLRTGLEAARWNRWQEVRHG